MERPNEDTSSEGFDLDFLFDAGNNDFGFLNPGDQSPQNQDAPLLEERDTQSHRHNISESMAIVKSVQSTDASELDAPSDDKRSRKRKIDREYRARQKAIKQKQEEDLQSLREENTKLRLELEMAKQKADKLENKSNDQINDVEECRIVFELDFPDEVAKRRLMMIAGGFPGITSIKMDAQRKRLILEGIDIDPLPLRDMLKKICNTKLVSFNISREKKKYEPKKAEENAVMFYKAADNPRILHPRPQGPPSLEPPSVYRHDFAAYNPRPLSYPLHLEPPSLYPHEFAEVHGTTSAPSFSFENAVIICFVILLLLLLIRPAVYNDILFRFMNLFSIFFDGIGHASRKGAVLMSDIFNQLRN